MRPVPKLLSGTRPSSFVAELVFILNDFIRHDHECLGVPTVRARLSRPLDLPLLQTRNFPPSRSLLIQQPANVPRDVYSKQMGVWGWGHVEVTQCWGDGEN